MSGICSRLNLPVYDPRARTATPKYKVQPAVITKQEKKLSKVAQEKAFRAGVWARDKSRCRASRKPLSRSGSDWDRIGEVHHCIPRSLAPERIYDVSNGLLLSKHMHALAETVCPNAPDKHLLDIEGETDRGTDQLFIWRDNDGNEKRRRIG